MKFLFFFRKNLFMTHFSYICALPPYTPSLLCAQIHALSLQHTFGVKKGGWEWLWEFSLIFLDENTENGSEELKTSLSFRQPHFFLRFSRVAPELVGSYSCNLKLEFLFFLFLWYQRKFFLFSFSFTHHRAAIVLWRTKLDEIAIAIAQLDSFFFHKIFQKKILWFWFMFVLDTFPGGYFPIFQLFFSSFFTVHKTFQFSIENIFPIISIPVVWLIIIILIHWIVVEWIWTSCRRVRVGKN